MISQFAHFFTLIALAKFDQEHALCTSGVREKKLTNEVLVSTAGQGDVYVRRKVRKVISKNAESFNMTLHCKAFKPIFE